MTIERAKQAVGGDEFVWQAICGYVTQGRFEKPIMENPHFVHSGGWEIGFTNLACFYDNQRDAEIAGALQRKQKALQALSEADATLSKWGHTDG